MVSIKCDPHVMSQTILLGDSAHSMVSYHGYSVVLPYYHGYSLVLPYYHGYSLVLPYYHGYSVVLPWLQFSVTMVTV